MVDSSIGSYDAERCIVQLVRTLRWDRPSGGARAEFAYPIEVQRRHGVIDWPPDAVKKQLRRARFRNCKGRRAGSVLSIYVGPGGRVLDAGISGAPDDELASCLVERALELQLPDPMGRVALLTLRL
jgi:hypothetical protein